MAITHVASVSAANNSAGVTTGSIDTTGATLLVAWVAYYYLGTPTISDSKGNTWTALTVSGSNPDRGIFYYVANPTVGSGHTFTLSGSSSYPCISVSSFAGVTTTSPKDQDNRAENSGSTTIQPGSVTPSEDNELVVAGVTFNYTGGSVTIDSSMTIGGQTAPGSGTNIGGAIARIIQTTAGAINPTWTATGVLGGMAAGIVTFKAAAAGSVTATPPTLALTLTTYAPTVSTPCLVTPTTASITLTSFAPTVSTPQLATPTTLALTTTAFAPTVTVDFTATPTTVALVLTTFAPTISTPVVVTPSTLALVLTTYAPSLGGVTTYPIAPAVLFEDEEVEEEFEFFLFMPPVTKEVSTGVVASPSMADIDRDPDDTPRSRRIVEVMKQNFDVVDEQVAVLASVQPHGITQKIFTEEGEHLWTCPPNVTSVYVEVYGKGGRGWDNSITPVASVQGNAGGGGGGGGYAAGTIPVTPGVTYRGLIEHPEQPDTYGTIYDPAGLRLFTPPSSAVSEFRGDGGIYVQATAGSCAYHTPSQGQGGLGVVGDVTSDGGNATHISLSGGGGGGGAGGPNGDGSDGGDVTEVGTYYYAGGTGGAGGGGDAGAGGAGGDTTLDSSAVFVSGTKGTAGSNYGGGSGGSGAYGGDGTFPDGGSAAIIITWTVAAFTDGDYGDITIADDVMTIDAGAVTLAKMADMATASLIYRKTAGTGAPEVNTLATLKTDLGLSGTNTGDQTSVTGNAGTATALATARTINGMSFDGTANIAAHYFSCSSTSNINATSTTWTGLHNIATLTDGNLSGISRSNSTLTFTRTGTYLITLTVANYSTNCYVGLRLRRTNNTAATLVHMVGYATGTSQNSPATMTGIFVVGATDDAIDLQYAISGTANTFLGVTIDSQAMNTVNCSIVQIG